MSRRIRLTAVAAALLAMVTTGTMAAPAASTAPGTSSHRTDRPSTSVAVPASAIGMHRLGSSDPAQRALAGSYRITESEWRNVEVRDDHFEWDTLDAVIGDARQRGATELLLIIGLTPTWARAGDASTSASPPRSLDLWEQWVRRVSTRYAGQGMAYQVWNEASIATFWTGGPELMAEMTQRAHEIVQETDPSGVVVAPSVTTRYGFAPFTPQYLAALARRGWPVDVFSVHTYPNSLGTPATRRQLIRMYLAALRRAGAPALPVWDTEVNFGMAGPGPKYPDRDITGRRAAAWVAQAYLDSIRMGLARTYWYQQQEPDDFLGIQMWTGTPGLAAQRWVYTWFADQQFRGCARSGRVVRCSFTGTRGSAQVLWTNRGRTRATVPSGAGSACTARGRCRTVTPGSRIRVTPLPVRLGPASDAG